MQGGAGRPRARTRMGLHASRRATCVQVYGLAQQWCLLPESSLLQTAREFVLAAFDIEGIINFVEGLDLNTMHAFMVEGGTILLVVNFVTEASRDELYVVLQIAAALASLKMNVDAWLNTFPFETNRQRPLSPRCLPWLDSCLQGYKRCWDNQQRAAGDTATAEKRWSEAALTAAQAELAATKDELAAATADKTSLQARLHAAEAELAELRGSPSSEA